MADLTLPEGPYAAPVVDATRRITVPWKGWIADWLARLQAAVNAALAGVGAVTAIGELTSASTAFSVGLVGQAFLELGRPRFGGAFLVEGSYTASQVGAPVVAQLFPVRLDETEGILTCARAEVLDSRRMRVHWSASSPLGGAVVLNFTIGGVA